MLDLLAQGNTFNLTPNESYANGLYKVTAQSIVSAGLILVLIVAAIVFFFILVLGGIKWIMSEGDKTKAEGARNMITAALIGLVIISAAWAITQLLAAFFGVDILGNLEVYSVQTFLAP